MIQLLVHTPKCCSIWLLEISLPCFIPTVANSCCLVFVSLLVIWNLTMVIFFWCFSENREGGVTCNAHILASRRNFDYVFSDSMDQSVFMRTRRQQSMYCIKKRSRPNLWHVCCSRGLLQQIQCSCSTRVVCRGSKLLSCGSITGPYSTST